MNSLALFEQYPYWIVNCAIMMGILILDLFFSIPEKLHPLTFFRVIAQRLTAKVFPDPNRAKQQQIIAGALAIAVATLPWLVIIYLTVQITEFPLFFEGLIFWLCLGFMPCLRDIKKVELALAKQQKFLARDRLADWVLRRTDNLSAIGIAKTACEVLILRNIYSYQAMILWFVIAGPYALLAVRLLLELQQVSNAKLNRFRYFSISINFCFNVVMWLPVKISTFTYAIKGGLLRGWQNAKQVRACWPYKLSLAPLVVVAHSLNVRLGGPVFYNQDKMQRPHLGENYPQPNHESIKATRYLIIASNLFLVALLCCASLVSYSFLR
ncbi:cobalamin biosynthesis protein CobD/CbiB [Algibacillus agarilyticus]|uniref:cobalamin biosynthesis protein CobD/CbiB n=1 Tax=Algibacillus agarilyticus TaxID=2234133 RepID=UPI000DCFD12E|nr:cobalamin biosynthesis protein [Algibacillus agarilyticus]